MKIAIITPVFLPYFAGISHVAANEARGLSQAGNEVTVITPRYSFQDSELEKTLKGYKVIRLNPLIKFGNAALIKYNKKLLKNFDIIHFHYPFIGGFFSLLRFISKSRIPLVVTYHMDLIGRGWKSWFFKLYTFLTLPNIIKITQKIIVSSLDYARNSNLAPDLLKEPQKFIEVPFGVETKNYETGIIDHELRNRLGIKEKEKTILFVGALDKAHYFKGVDILLKSFREVNLLPQISCRLIIVGDGDLRLRYEKQAQDLDMPDKVIFAGRVSKENLRSYYKLADIFVLPSIDSSEACGLVLLEAMSFGIPVIASNLPGVRTQVGDRGLLIDPKKEDELTEALKNVLMNETMRMEMGRKARRWIKINRSFDLETKNILAVYKSVDF